MRAVILSAGQGRRLLPLTADRPKCLLDLHGRSVLEWQVEQLHKCGIDQVTVVVGYGAQQVEELLTKRWSGSRVKALYNPFYAVSDNLGTCWIAREAMQNDFILLNGDTLFEQAVLERLLTSPDRPITLTTDRKGSYDEDDMKVQTEGERLMRVGKDLPLDRVNGESIGMSLYRGEGVERFRSAVETALRKEVALKRWYLSVVDQLAREGHVWTCCIEGLDWAEIDCHEDLREAARMVGFWNGTAPIEREAAQAGRPCLGFEAG